MAPGIKVPGGQWLLFGGDSWKTTVASVPIDVLGDKEKLPFGMLMPTLQNEGRLRNATALAGRKTYFDAGNSESKLQWWKSFTVVFSSFFGATLGIASRVNLQI
jgi:hypothetical protein